ncbi:MAG: PKD repeat protein [Parvicella sp.]|jgi:hypothetical protein
MKKILLSAFALVSIAFTAQTTINFDDDTKWTAGSATLSSYAADHAYADGVFSATGGPGLRNGSAAQNGFPGANGIYSWRMQNIGSVSWEANIASGGVNNFSLDIRRWDDAPEPQFVFEYSTDLGTSWTLIDTINNTTLGNSSDFQTYTGVVNSANNNIKFRISSFGTTERIMVDDFMWVPFGGSATLDTIATITSVDATVFENAGTVNVNVELSMSATLDKTVDLVLTSGNSAVVNGFTSQTVTFTGGSTMETVTLTIVPGMLTSASEIFDFELNNPGTGVTMGTGTDTLYQLTVNEIPVGPPACSNLFFSEYIEGSSNNKALEIYNPTTGIIDLSNYAIRRYNNGAATPSSTFYLSGNLTPGNVYVIANSQADPSILAVADITSGIASFNGDDAVELYDTTNMAAIDLIGEIGVDPGASWPVGTGSTSDNSLVRMASVDAGALVWAGLGDTQWDVMPTDDFTDLGTHTNTSCTAPIPLTAYPIIGDTSVCIGDTIVFDHTSFGGSTPYTVGWTINGTNYVQDSVWYIVTASGAISAQLAVVDAALASDNVTTAFTIANAPVAGFILSANTICEGDIATITSTATGGNISYTYSDFASAGTFNVSSSTGDGDYTNTSGIYDLQQTVIDSNGCSSAIVESLTILITEDASFAALADICELDTVILSHTNATGVWSGTGVVDQGSGQGYFTESAGTFGITYTIAGTCGDTYTDSVDVFDLPVAGFTNSGSPVVNFTNTSTVGVSYTWDFGNGNTSSAQDPTNTYTTNGVYPVTLTVTSANGCINSIIIDVTIQGLSITENQVSFEMYPNPATDIVTIKTIGNSSEIEVINLIGETVYTAKSNGNTTINVSGISKGAYFIRVTEGTASSTQKLIIR